MTQMTNSQARVIDPILTEVARGFKQAEFVGGFLFPTVPVDQRGGKIISFGREDFMLYGTARAPGTNTKRVQYGHQSGSYSLESHSLEGLVPFELMQDANAVPGIDLARIAIQRTQRIVALRLEKAQADLAITSGNYGAGMTQALSGTSQWSDYSGTSKPSTDIEAAKEAIRAKVGLRGNTVLMGAAVFSKLREHPTILDRIKYTSRDTVTTDLLAALWGVGRVVVGDATYVDDSGTQIDVWGKNVVVAYTDISSLRDMGSPSFAYTYQLRNYPIVEVPYQDRNAKSWIYPVTDEVAPVIAGNTAGFLLQTVVA